MNLQCAITICKNKPNIPWMSKTLNVLTASLTVNPVGNSNKKRTSLVWVYNIHGNFCCLLTEKFNYIIAHFVPTSYTNSAIRKRFQCEKKCRTT